MKQKAGTIIHTVNRLNMVFTVAWSVSGVEKGYFATETENKPVYISLIFARKS